MKHSHAVGIDIDHYSIRAAAAVRSHDRDVPVLFEKCVEIRGTFVKDSDITEGLKKIKEQLGTLAAGARIAASLSGKQVYTGKLAFQKMPYDAMKKALKFEIRKELPFEASTAVLEFQKLNDGEMRHDEKVDIMVSAAASAQVTRQMRLLTDAGLKPSVIEALPLMIANSFWVGAREGGVDAANIVLHIGPDIAVLVIDGEHLPYFNRLIYFSAVELFAPGEEEPVISGIERERRLAALSEEIVRSLSYYEENFENVTFATINLMGAYITPELVDSIRENTRLDVALVDLASRFSVHEVQNPGKFDLSIALALQALE